MYPELTTKRSPIVLIWQFAAIEAAGLFAYYLATLLGNAKYVLYTHLFFSNLIPYQTARVAFLFGAEFLLTVYVFLSWYYEDYTVRHGEVVHRWGVFLKRHRSFPTAGASTLAVSSGPFGKLLHYGTIRMEHGGTALVMRTVSRPQRIADAIRGRFETPAPVFGGEPDLNVLLAQAEHDALEFKSSLRFDYKAGNASRELEKAVMKTVAAFMNSKGGYLVIGVSDAREPIGLEQDYRTLQRKDSDGFENHFTQSFNAMIGPEFRGFVKLWFRTRDGRDVCIVQALPSHRPVYLKTENNEHFYMRTGNISTALKLSEIESYARSRWPAGPRGNE